MEDALFKMHDGWETEVVGWRVGDGGWEIEVVGGAGKEIGNGSGMDRWVGESI